MNNLERTQRLSELLDGVDCAREALRKLWHEDGHEEGIFPSFEAFERAVFWEIERQRYNAEQLAGAKAFGQKPHLI